MNLKRVLLFLVFISFFLSFFQVHAESSGYNLSDPIVYDLTERYVIKNTGTTQITDLEIDMFSGTFNNFTYQKDLDISYSLKPSGFKNDKIGNKIAHYNISRLGAGKNIKLEVSRKCKASDIKYLIDSSNSSNIISDKSALKNFLSSDKKIESENEKIILKAKELTNGIEDNYSKAQEIFKFVNFNMTYDTSDTYRNKGALSAFITRRGVCEDYASLFTALCRASGIPARVITGYRFTNCADNFNNEKWNDISNYGHAWAEFYIEDYGWIPVETTELYVVNGIKEVYQDGFACLGSNKYIATGLYSASTSALSVSYSYETDTNPQIEWEPVKTMIKIDQETESTNSSLQTNHNFIDLTSAHWAYKYVIDSCDKDITKGYQNNTFRPDDNISRIEFIVMLSRMLKYLNFGSSNNDVFVFYDYPSNHWSKYDYKYLANCFEETEPSDGAAGQETLTRVFDDSLKPNQPITREEAVALFDKFLKDPDVFNESFSDIDNSRFKASILKAYWNNLITGYSNNQFKPKSSITRAEAAKLFYTFLNK